MCQQQQQRQQQQQQHTNRNIGAVVYKQVIASDPGNCMQLLPSTTM
jgi:hypothetical protein